MAIYVRPNGTITGSLSDSEESHRNYLKKGFRVATAADLGLEPPKLEPVPVKEPEKEPEPVKAPEVAAAPKGRVRRPPRILAQKPKTEAEPDEKKWWAK